MRVPKLLFSLVLAIPLYGVSTAYSADVDIVVDKALGQKILSAVEFPLQVEFPSSLSTQAFMEPSLGDAEMQGEIEFLPPGREVSLLDEDEVGAAIEDAINQAIESRKNGTLDESLLDEDERKALDLLSRHTEKGGIVSSSLLSKNNDDIGKALQLLINKSRIKFELIWLKFRIPERPNLTVSNPIVISDITTRTQMKVKACIRVGKWWCARPTTPWIHADGKQLFLELLSQGAIVSAMPRFKDLDLVIKIKIYRWTIKIPIGVTTIVNQEIRKRGPIQIMDLSAFEQSIPYSGKKALIESILFSSDPKGLVVKATMVIK